MKRSNCIELIKFIIEKAWKMIIKNVWEPCVCPALFCIWNSSWDKGFSWFNLLIGGMATLTCHTPKAILRFIFAWVPNIWNSQESNCHKKLSLITLMQNLLWSTGFVSLGFLLWHLSIIFVAHIKQNCDGLWNAHISWLSKERNPFPAQNQTLRAYIEYIFCLQGRLHQLLFKYNLADWENNFLD